MVFDQKFTYFQNSSLALFCFTLNKPLSTGLVPEVPGKPTVEVSFQKTWVQTETDGNFWE